MGPLDLSTKEVVDTIPEAIESLGDKLPAETKASIEQEVEIAEDSAVLGDKVDEAKSKASEGTESVEDGTNFGEK